MADFLAREAMSSSAMGKTRLQPSEGVRARSEAKDGLKDRYAGLLNEPSKDEYP
jgi:hypothetical protein